MRQSFSRCGAFALAGILVLSQIARPLEAGASGTVLKAGAVLRAGSVAVSGHKPVQIAVPEPARRTPPPFVAMRDVRPLISHAIHRPPGVRVPGPPMLRPSEIDLVARMSRNRARQLLVHRPVEPQRQMDIPRAVEPTRTRGAAPVMSATRSTQSVQSESGTGINPWWRYQEENVPGDGRAMVNVGTGNLVFQDDDMSVPHKGISLAFRRTYNSQSLHNVNGDEGAGTYWTNPGLYGNGWTNTFDAHVVKSGKGMYTVYDIDGARYDYVAINPNDVSTGYNGPPGQHATLTFDGNCGFLWTKKSGTTYYFYRDNPSVTCTALNPIGGYAGRLYQIIGRNRNTSLTFSYSWDNGDASATGKINAITVQAESGMSATLSFADVAGHRLLQQITFPDGITTVAYGYDAAGNLTSVSRPPNNAGGTRPVQTFGYQTLGTGSVLQWAASPRWCASTCGTDGAFTAFGFAGSSPSSATVSAVALGAVINPTVPDGSSSTVLQPGYPTGAYYYVNEYYATGVSTPTFRDTDGHATNWVVDSFARPTQTQECTAGTNQTCTGNYLVTNETWDADNNLVSETDPRGNETDYLYDPMGNATAVGEPYTTTSQGSFKPTQLLDYDGFNNVVAYCDANATHAAGADWTTPAASVSSNESLCASQAGGVPHWHATYAYPSWQTYGELASMTTPSGYTRTVSYAASQQGGVDYGLPTSVSEAPFTQIDGSTIAPSQTFWYDANGYLRCYSKGQGTSVLSYDALGRILSVADPDDSSANASSLCAKSTGQPGWNTQTTYAYFPDGAMQSSQTPSERAGGVSTSFTYDLDGNTTTETRHHSCVSGSACNAGVTTKWYDGADRLVEVALPHDGSDIYSSQWLTRYLYDLSGGSSVSIAGTAFRAYGNLFKTQEWVPSSVGTSPAWLDLRGSAFDGLDRVTTKYNFSPSSNTTPRATTLAYDTTSATLGLLASTTDPLNETTSYTYDELGHTSSLRFTGDGGVTPTKSFMYDAVGHQTRATGAVYGTETTQFDADGRVSEVDEPANGSITSPARLIYDYYPNGQRKDLRVASSALTASPFLSYAYRNDGMRSRLHVGYGQSPGDFIWSYTDGGRTMSQADPYTGTVMPSPQSPVAPGTLYPAKAWAYDSTGQLSSITLPQTFAYQSIAHDDEGNVVSWMGSSSFNGPAAMSFGITVRGENVAQSLGALGISVHATRIANGATIPVHSATHASGSPPTIPWSFTIDPVNAIVASTSQEQYVRNSDPSGPTWEDCGSMTTSHGYDAASRMISSIATMNVNTALPDCADYDAGPDTTPLYSYDAENHHITTSIGSPGTNGIQWSPSGHAYKIQSWNLHYDGNQLLFITDSNGALMQAKVELLGKYYPSTNTVTVSDRGISNQNVSQHDGSFYGGISLGTTMYRPPGPSSSSQSVPYIFYGSTNDTTCTMPGPSGASCAGGATFDYVRPEGFIFGGLTFQGVRAVNEASGQWTTPDAYAGDVHDPISQKAFMWDRNNPYAYQDPSGFVPDASNHEDRSWGTAGWWGRENDGEDGVQVAMDSTALPAPSDVMNAARTAVDKALQDHYIRGVDLRTALEKRTNEALANVQGGKYAVAWRPSNKGGFEELRNQTSSLRIYESTTHGGRGDGGIKIVYNMNPGKMADRMGWNPQVRGSWTTNLNSNFNAPRTGFVPIGINARTPE